MTLERIIIENRRNLLAGAPEHRVDVGSAPTYIEEQGQGGKSPLLILSTDGIFQIFFLHSNEMQQFWKHVLVKSSL